ncbi:calcium/proton exchanger [Kwoniella bestiolae CBS 10118]|uniref:Calcium/proton exchanger n=1 Tax=Kwoniella bestiolae CBS 10118 TaxID=1296100 RepID=A0A1B9G9R1_9TREE|nr:calcium/proton exchanger [Kwoniella bestiolae CBS 10118]OCF27768.1 calcium/proton exchanger [Kwoniella bestiolae CBS 10118]
MITPAVVEPEPEPDIGGFTPSYTQSHNTNTNINQQYIVNSQHTPPSSGEGQNHAINQDAPIPIGPNEGTPTPTAGGKGGILKQPGSRSSSFARTILKPRSKQGHSRMPSITITDTGNNANTNLEEKGQVRESVDDDGRNDFSPPARSSSAPNLGGKNRLAPLKSLSVSIPLPPKRGPPEGEEEHIKKTFIEPTWTQSFRNTIKSQPFLVAMPVLLPISWALHFTHQDPVAVFVTSLIAIVPLAGGLGFATEELAHRVGEAWGGLLNASFGNAVELLIAILALVKGDIDIVQASMVGSILSNVLLVLGMSYFAGGLRFHEQLYTVIGAQMHISLLGLSLLAIVLPAAYHVAYPNVQNVVNDTRSGLQPEGVELQNLLKMSRGLSFILLAVYGMFLTFQLYTHAYLFRIPKEKVAHPLPGPAPHHEHVFPRPHWVSSIADSSSSSSSSSTSSGSSIRSGRSGHSPFKRFRRFSVSSKKEKRQARDGAEADTEDNTVIGSNTTSHAGEKTLSPTVTRQSPPITATTPVRIVSNTDEDYLRPPPVNVNDDRDVEADSISSSHNIIIDDDGTVHVQPKVKFWFALGMLTVVTGLAGFTAECLVDSIDGLTETGNVSREFVGLILLPVIGNSVEHITAVTVSVKDKLNLSMSIAVGSSIQVSLCLLPILVLIGWAIGQPMLLFFDNFETITLVVSLLLVNFAIADGRTNYLEGFVMMMAYLMIALVCWFYDPAV